MRSSIDWSGFLKLLTLNFLSGFVRDTLGFGRSRLQGF